MDPPFFNRARTASDGISTEGDPLTQSEFDDFNQENSFIVVYGIVSYKDFFGVSHWTKMCAFFPKPGATKGVNAKQCADYGDIDEQLANSDAVMVALFDLEVVLVDSSD